MHLAWRLRRRLRWGVPGAIALCTLGLTWAQSAAIAATYGAHNNPAITGPTLTWVLFDQPDGQILGYMCEDTTGDAMRGIGSAPGTLDILNRYMILAGSDRPILILVHQVVLGYEQNYGGRSHYFWRFPIEAVEDPAYANEGGSWIDWARINPQTGWYVNNAPVSAVGRTCVNGGLNAVLEQFERQYNTRFEIRDSYPDW